MISVAICTAPQKSLLPPAPDVLSEDAHIRCFFHMSETAAGLGTARATGTSVAIAHVFKLTVRLG
jgi:hypothetical protein